MYLDTKNLNVKWVGRKLGPRRIGPLTVLERINPLSYRISMPHGSTAHNVFHVSRLTAERLPPPAHQVKGTNPPPAVDSHLPEWEVEDIIGYRQLRGRPQYLVKWRGYPEESNSWEPERNLRHAKQLLKAFQDKSPTFQHKEGATVRNPPRVPDTGSKAAGPSSRAFAVFEPVARPQVVDVGGRQRDSNPALSDRLPDLVR